MICMGVLSGNMITEYTFLTFSLHPSTYQKWSSRFFIFYCYILLSCHPCSCPLPSYLFCLLVIHILPLYPKYASFMLSFLRFPSLVIPVFPLSRHLRTFPFLSSPRRRGSYNATQNQHQKILRSSRRMTKIRANRMPQKRNNGIKNRKKTIFSHFLENFINL